jgi:hypothetical protein
MKDNEEIEQIAQNNKLICKTCHIKQHFHHVHQDQQDGIYKLYWNLVLHNLLTSSNKNKQTKHKFHPKLIFPSTRSSVHSPIICYNLQTNQQRFDSRGVTDIQYCYVSILPISPSLITVARMHSTLHPCSSNQFNTAQLESKLTSIQIMLISSHEIEH